MSQCRERSAGLSKTKIKKMDERNKLMENIKNEAAAKLTKELASNPEAYKELMKKLILQVPSLDSMIIRGCSS